MIRIRFRVDMESACSVGPGKIALLEGVLETGSLSAAARRLGMSYRRAWLLLDSLNRSFQRPLTSASIGGRGGGGVALTELGREIIEEYRRMQADFDRLAARRWKSTARLVQPRRAARLRPGVTPRMPASRSTKRGRVSKRP
jgi:molybdate transport system regulatory protein